MVCVRHQISVTSTVRKETQVWGVTVLTHQCVCVCVEGGGVGRWMVYVRHQISVTSTVRKETQVWGGDIFNSPVCVCVGGGAVIKILLI